MQALKGKYSRHISCGVKQREHCVGGLQMGNWVRNGTTAVCDRVLVERQLTLSLPVACIVREIAEITDPFIRNLLAK